ncbi:MAG: hypothetical protein M5U08_11920 [Burkholderiales bacterium]|nr:hypothetical protein [Burkholderiales bacterium]
MRSRIGICRPRLCTPAMMSSMLTPRRLPSEFTLTVTEPSSPRSK